MSRNLFLVCCVVACLPLKANAYKEETHETLTREAANRSVLQGPSVLTDLGLRSITDPTQTFFNSQGHSRTIIELLEDGSRFEDEPPGTLFSFRSRRHFYNPLSGRGLDISAIPTQISSPDWALAPRGSFSDQQNSYADARQDFFDALTSRLEDERKVAFGQTFQTLGQVVHHLEDMAQPQHVRNDAHCDLPPCQPVRTPLGTRSLYESWTNDVRGNLPTDPSTVGYDVTSPAFTSTFTSPRSFWRSDIGGKGIAEFTNRNFVSAGTNFDTTRFQSPVRDESTRYTRMIEDLCPTANPPCNLSGSPITFYTNPVIDNFTGTTVNNPLASSLSIFDADLQKANVGQRLFTLNRFNFALAHTFLIPRAVAYSAGMINYFFRGKIDLVPDNNNPGTFLIKNLGNEPMNGKFSLYYDDAGNNRKLVNESLYSGPIAANGQQPIGTLPDPATLNPAPKKPGEYMLVFTGDMGAETAAQSGIGAVVGKVVNIRTVIDLGSVISPIAINNRGDVVGVDGFLLGRETVLWSSVLNLGTLPGDVYFSNFNGGVTALALGALPGDTFSGPLGISDNGQILGVSGRFGPPEVDHFFLWTSSTGMQDITNSGIDPIGINDSGVIAGIAVDPVVNDFRAAIWSSTSGIQSLGQLPGNFGTQDQSLVPRNSYFTSASAINNSGQVVGTSTTNCFPGPLPGVPACQVRAFVWSSATGMRDLGTLGFSSTACAAAGAGLSSGSLGRAISSDGRVAGMACLPDGSTTAVMWSSAGVIQDLGKFQGLSTTVTGINKHGQVVGFANTGVNVNSHIGFLWTNGVMISLSDLPEFKAAGFTMVERAAGINDLGQIIGVAVGQDGRGHAFLYTPSRTSP